MKRTIHGNLIVVNGTGTLILGEAGSGKTTVCMELSDRGHHFIADDAVVIEKKGESVVGKASSVTGGQMNVCGAGIVEIPINLGAPFCYKINLIVEIGIAKINSESNKDLIGFTDGSDELLNIRKVKLHGQTLTLASSIEELTK